MMSEIILNRYDNIIFQFLNGAIGCYQNLTKHLTKHYFNSLMVRLDASLNRTERASFLISIP